MDPVTALGLSVNILQLVEIGITITKKIKEIHERGSLSVLDEVEQWAEDIARERKQLQGDLQPLGRNLHRSDTRVLDLAQQAINASEELKKLLNSITLGKRQAGTNQSSLKVALRSYLKKGKIEELTKRLQVCESNLGKAMLTELYVRSGKAEVLSKKSFSSLTAGQQDIIRCIVATDGKSFKAIVQSIEAISAKTIDQIVKSEEGLHAHLDQVRLDDRALRRRRRLLESLHFENIDQRRSMIRQRVGDYGDTFKWAFEPGQAHGFHEWLVSDHSLYWISGKPGSGKSSFIDYVLEHLEPDEIGRRLLEQWAAPAPLLLASVFFYKPAADRLQKGYEGFWRSLCFQLLTADAALADKVLIGGGCPEAISKRLSIDIDSKLQWMVHELEALFFHLLKKTNCRVFLLLDGLDEFAESHLKLLNTIKQLAALPGLKVCCSSRADAPFDSGLAGVPNLRIHDLTYSDIESVVKQRLAGTRASRLIESVVWKAEGVFLWAHLVTEDIAVCMVAEESIERLEELIDDAPSDMFSLFAAMLKRAHPSFSKRPKQYLKCLCVGLEFKGGYWSRTYVSELLFVDSDQVELQKCLTSGFTDDYVSRLVESATRIRQQVLAHCAGLVQIESVTTNYLDDEWVVSYNNQNGTSLDLSPLQQLSGLCVEFIHRCAFDFLMDDPTGQAFVDSCSLSRCSASLALLRANVAKLCLDARFPIGAPSSEDCLDPKIGRLQAQLESYPDLHPEYHLLTTQCFDHLFNAADDHVHSQVGTPRNFLFYENDLCSTRMLVSNSIAWYYTHTYGLFSWFKSRAKAWSLSQRQTAVVLVWCHAASEASDKSINPWLELLADLQAMCGVAPVAPAAECSGLISGLHSALPVYAIPQQPVWVCVMALLVDAWLLGWSDPDDWVSPTVQILDTLLEPQLSTSERLEFTVLSNPGNIGSLAACPGPGQERAGIPPDFCALTLRCTLNSLISFLLPGLGHQGLGVSGFEQLPEITHWKPRGINKWLQLQEGPYLTVHSMREAVYEMKGERDCRVNPDQLAKLNENELAIIRKYHEESEPGHYRQLWG